MVLSLIYHVIKKICKTIINVAAWLLVALSLWIPLVYTVIFVVWCGIAGKSLSALSTIYWAGLAITFIGSFFVSAFLYERKQKGISKQSVKNTPDNAESVKYKRDTAELKKRSTLSEGEFEEEEMEPSDISAHKKVNKAYREKDFDEEVEEENRLTKHIRQERDKVHKQEEISDSKARLNKEDLFAAKAAEAERRDGSMGHRPQASYTNSYNQPQNPYGFTPYNNGQTAPQNPNPNNQQNSYGFTPYNEGQNTPPPPFINPYKQNNNNPLSQANNPYNQPNPLFQNYQQKNYGQNNGQQDFGFAPYNANPYANQQNNSVPPPQNYNNSAANPYGFASYDANPYKLKNQPDLNSGAENPYDSFYNQGESYKAFDRDLTGEIRLNTQRQESETPKVFAVKNDPTVFIHEYSDRLEYYKRTRQGMMFMKAVNK